MGIIEQAKLADRRIADSQQLIEQEIETVRIIYEHHAISRAEYFRSTEILKNRLASMRAKPGRRRLSDVISSYRDAYSTS